MQIEHLINNLFESMKAKHMTQKDLSKKSGVGESAISQYLSGSRVPKLDNLYKISIALDVDIRDLLEIHLGYSEWHDMCDKYKLSNFSSKEDRQAFYNDFLAISKIYLRNLSEDSQQLPLALLQTNLSTIDSPLDIIDAYNKAIYHLRFSALNMDIAKWIKIKQYLDWFKE